MNVLEMALEALEIVWENHPAIDALKEAIKQQGEPVGEVVNSGASWDQIVLVKFSGVRPALGTKLYTSAPTMLTAQAPCDIPEGWQLVPIEPTPEMLVDGRDADFEWSVSDDDRNGLSVIYKAMLSAAPERKGEKG